MHVADFIGTLSVGFPGWFRQRIFSESPRMYSWRKMLAENLAISATVISASGNPIIPYSTQNIRPPLVTGAGVP